MSAQSDINDNRYEMGNSGNRIFQFSYIRAIACFTVVLLHCLNTSRVYYEEYISDLAYSAVTTSCSILMWAVPCFLMVTGALLLDSSREIPLSRLFGKYIRRILTALLVFTFIFTLIKYAAGDMQGSRSFAGFFMANLIRNEAMPHLWYLYLMICLYLLLPILKKGSMLLSSRSLIIVSAVVSIVAGIFTFTDTSSFWHMPFSPGCVIYPTYLIIGYLLFNDNIKPVFAIPCLVFSTLALASFTWSASQTGYDVFAVSSYSSPLVVVQSASVFSLMLRIRTSAGRLIRSLDSCSFGIYLIHMIFVRLAMKDLGFNPFLFGPFAFLPMAAVFFITSYGITVAVKRCTGSVII